MRNGEPRMKNRSRFAELSSPNSWGDGRHSSPPNDETRRREERGQGVRDSPCLLVSLSPCLLVSLSPCLLVSFSPCFLVSLSPCLLFSFSSRLLFSFSPCLLVSLSPCLLVSLSPCLLASFPPFAFHRCSSVVEDFFRFRRQHRAR